MKPLIDYAITIYEHPEVKEALLKLQDRHRLDVNISIWAVWCGRYGIALEADEAVGVIATVMETTVHVTRPLRAVRRYLTTPRPGFPEAKLKRLRDQTLQLEIASEELVLQRLGEATLAAAQANPELHDMKPRAERLFTLARGSMDMPTLIADEEGPYSPLGLFRNVLNLAEEHGP